MWYVLWKVYLDSGQRGREEMQGTFRKRGENRLEVVWEDTLSHPDTSATPAGAGHPAIFVPPPQNFYINDERFFITRQTNTAPVVTGGVRWLVSRQKNAGGIIVDPANPVEYRDFVNPSPLFFDVGEFWLRPRLEEAERRDYQFALRMQVSDAVLPF